METPAIPLMFSVDEAMQLVGQKEMMIFKLNQVIGGLNAQIEEFRKKDESAKQEKAIDKVVDGVFIKDKK